MSSITVKIPNFTVEELRCKCGCKSFYYDHSFLIKLQALRFMMNMPLTVTSGCRCIKHNQAIGGEGNSTHVCEGKPSSGVDLKCSNMQLLFMTAKMTHLFNEVIWNKAKGYVHCAVDPNQKGNYWKII